MFRFLSMVFWVCGEGRYSFFKMLWKFTGRYYNEEGKFELGWLELFGRRVEGGVF